MYTENSCAHCPWKVCNTVLECRDGADMDINCAYDYNFVYAMNDFGCYEYMSAR